MEDFDDVVVAVATGFQDRGEQLQVGDGIEFLGRLLVSEAAVEVGADGDVIGVAGDLADVINMIDDIRIGNRILWAFGRACSRGGASSRRN